MGCLRFRVRKTEPVVPGNYSAPGLSANHPTNKRYDAALVRCIDFEREISEPNTDAKIILLLAFREHQPQRVIAQIVRSS